MWLLTYRIAAENERRLSLIKPRNVGLANCILVICQLESFEPEGVDFGVGAVYIFLWYTGMDLLFKIFKETPQTVP